MLTDIVLAVAATVVAIYGISRDFNPLQKKALIGLAVFIGVVTMFKAYSDYTEKEFTKKALIGTLQAPASATEKIFLILNRVARKNNYTSTNYMRVDDGMIVYLYKRNLPVETILLDHQDIAGLYSEILSERESNKFGEKIWEHIPYFDNTASEDAIALKLIQQSFSAPEDSHFFSEDLYGRLCILAHSSVKQITRNTNYFDCDYDDELGLNVSYGYNNKNNHFNIPNTIISDIFFSQQAENTRISSSNIDNKMRSIVIEDTK